MKSYRRINMDKFYSTSHLDVVRGAFKIVSSLQGSGEFMIASTAALFILACERWQIRPTVALDAAHRMLRDARLHDGGHHYEAIRRTLEDDHIFDDGFRDG